MHKISVFHSQCYFCIYVNETTQKVTQFRTVSHFKICKAGGESIYKYDCLCKYIKVYYSYTYLSLFRENKLNNYTFYL